MKQAQVITNLHSGIEVHNLDSWSTGLYFTGSEDTTEYLFWLVNAD